MSVSSKRLAVRVALVTALGLAASGVWLQADPPAAAPAAVAEAATLEPAAIQAVRHTHRFPDGRSHARAGEEGADHFFSAVINRWHDNVNSMFFESDFLDPSKDTLDFVPGSVGSYPNAFFVVDRQDIPDFFDVLANYDDSPAYRARARRYAVNRSDPEFWQTYDWFQNWLDENEPLESGLYDLNRYYSEARGDEDLD